MHNSKIAPEMIPEKVMPVPPVNPFGLDYSELLNDFSLEYKKTGYYWQVGEITGTQGWILHLSVITMQIKDLAHAVLPLLIGENVPFKLIQDKETAKDTLYGSIGYQKMAQIISIYPDNDINALALSKKLIKITQSFRGPAIPTDIRLGGIVYTRYGGFNPILISNAAGEEEEYIYNLSGELIKDPFHIPFQLPNGIKWPFSELASPIPKATGKILNNIYKPLSVIKTDPRGNVIKGIYLKNLFRIGACAIKVGKKNMVADDLGRDIQDRLLWQQELQKQLQGIIPLPKIIDLFNIDEDMYLVMEFIKGVNLFDRIVKINQRHKGFFQLSVQEQSLLLNYLFQILSIIDKLHKKGYVHRDIAPGNFLIDAKNDIYLIDMELAYHISDNNSLPPFELGTRGFMSPEQEAISIPTFKEDIYGLGALMIVIFTGLSPARLNTRNRDTLPIDLNFFIGHRGVSDLIAQCLDINPMLRPDLSILISSLEKYRKEWESSDYRIIQSPGQQVADIPLVGVIQQAVDGLSKYPMPIFKGRWMSKSQTAEGSSQKEYVAYAGLNTGMGGVMYLLAKAAHKGYNIDSAKRNYYYSLEFLESKYFNSDTSLDPGLYHGKAGLALSLAKGIDAELLENNSLRRQQIRDCFIPLENDLSLSTGLSGQAMALLQCSAYLESGFLQSYLQRVIQTIVNAQQKTGTWLEKKAGSRSKDLSIGFGHGITGIIWFLLAYYVKYPDETVKEVLTKSLQYLLKKTGHGKLLLKREAYRKIVVQEMGDERTGVILSLIKAFEVLRDPVYKAAAESVLSEYPEFVVNNNFSQDGGLAGLGEVYCEAWRVFHNPKWRERSEQIMQVFFHTALPIKRGGLYWLMEETDTPAADLMVGNSGIIHFLLRCQAPDEIGFVMLD